MNINFNNPYRYYFTCLSDAEKKVYFELFTGLTNFEDKIAVPYAGIEAVSKIFRYILLDNPLIHYVSTFTHWSDSSKVNCTIEPKYKYSKLATKKWHNDIIRYLLKFDRIRNKSEYERELYVHEHCLNNSSYDYSFDEISHTIMGVILENRAVCEGVSKFVKLVFDYIGLKSIVVTGDAINPQSGEKEGHAWNIVEIAGKMYHLDVTFDMTLTSNKSMHRFDYFNLPDKDVLIDHTNMSRGIPECSYAMKNYFVVNSMYIENLGELKAYIADNIRRGNKRIYFKLA